MTTTYVFDQNNQPTLLSAVHCVHCGRDNCIQLNHPAPALLSRPNERVWYKICTRCYTHLDPAIYGSLITDLYPRHRNKRQRRHY